MFSILQCLTCPLCFEIYKEPSLLSCGHTFCLRCLRKYDETSRRWNHTVCPICRKNTALSERRMEGLPRNITVNSIIDHLKLAHRRSARHPDSPATCSACEQNLSAVAFCRDCYMFMCEPCKKSHRQLTSLFAEHRVVATQDVFQDNGVSEKESTLVQGNEELPGACNCVVPIMSNYDVSIHGSFLLSLSGTLDIEKKVDLPHRVAGMTSCHQDRVVIGYGRFKPGAECFSLSGVKTEHAGQEHGNIYDVVCLENGQFVLSHAGGVMKVINADMSPAHQQFKRGGGLTSRGYYNRLFSNQRGSIYAVSKTNEMCVYRAGAENPHEVLLTGHIQARQVSVTKNGVIIASTCDIVPSTVAVFDAEGRLGSTLQSTGYPEYLYATVDSEDRVLIARVKPGVLRLSLFTLEGTRLVELKEFDEVLLDGIHHAWCYMSSLSNSLLAFASSTLYFIRLSA